jgi:hypothetical protein
MSVCEMQRRLARADYDLRLAEFERKEMEYERAKQKGARPVTPKLRSSIGIAGVYCRMLALFDVKTLQAQSPPASQAANDTNGTKASAAPVAAPATVPPKDHQDVMYESRITEAKYRVDQARRERNRYDVEIQKKFSLAAACIIFVLIGAPIALRFPRGGVGLVIGVSFSIFGLYYVGLIGGETLADKDFLPPWVAMWAVNVILLVIGLVLASQMGRETSTSRGGDFAELLATVRGKFLGWLRRFGIAIERRRP